jgi:DNA-binding PadR family transcriptional regulator
MRKIVYVAGAPEMAARLRQLSQEVFRVELGSLYPALCRLEAQG